MSSPVFLLRWLKNLVLLALLVGLIYWGANYRVHGEPLYKVVSSTISSGNYKEGFKDLRVFFGGFLKTVGEQMQQEEVSEKDRRQFESLIKEKAKEGAKK